MSKVYKNCFCSTQTVIELANSIFYLLLLQGPGHHRCNVWKTKRLKHYNDILSTCSRFSIHDMIKIKFPWNSWRNNSLDLKLKFSTLDSNLKILFIMEFKPWWEINVLQSWTVQTRGGSNNWNFQGYFPFCTHGFWNSAAWIWTHTK